MADFTEEDKKLPNNEYHCCLCGNHFADWGNNPYPLCDDFDMDSRCCDACNAERVLPARFALHTGVAIDAVRMYGRKPR